MDQAEDFNVQATLSNGDVTVGPVPCKIYLPARVNDRPRMEFRPEREQYARITGFHDVSFRAEVTGFSNETEAIIEAPIVYLQEKRTKHWGSDFSESTFSGEPQHLCVKRFLRKSSEPQKTNVVFWISPNNMLSPQIAQTTSYLGTVERERIHQHQFTISNNITLTFDRHFRSGREQNGDLRQWSYLVACADIDSLASDVECLKREMLPEIDDFLLIASLGSRTRTACIGWNANDHEVSATYYRGEYTFPSGQTELSFDQGLVQPWDFHDFLECAYSNYMKLPDKRSIRGAIYSVVPGRKRVLEESFISKFAGLETIILDYRKREGFEKILSAEKWNHLQKYLKNSIKKFDNPELSEQEISLLYEKLQEINRISLRTAFEEFCKKNNIFLEDLWPVFSQNNSIGLVDIRNRIVHGEPLPEELLGALSTANESLRFAIERILASMLGWPIERTEVAPDYISVQWAEFPVLKDQQNLMLEKLQG